MNNANNIQGYPQNTYMTPAINGYPYNTVDLYRENVQNMEDLNYRYWREEENYNQIAYNEQNKYNFVKSKEFSILFGINRINEPIRLWRYKDEFYYRPSEYSELIIGDEKKIAKEISSRNSNVNIHFVSDINDVLTHKKMEIRIDTTYIAINSIPVVDYEVFDVKCMDEIFVNHQGTLSRNLLAYTPYLSNRFHSAHIKNTSISDVGYFIENMTIIKNCKFISNKLGNFFNHLSSSEVLVFIGNKDVSEDIFFNKIIKQICGSHNCITITDKILQTMSTEEIIKHKLVYHINDIPDDEKDREKLKEILISILVDQYFQTENDFIPIYGQIIFTLNEPHLFIKDFLSSCYVFFVDTMKNIMTYLKEEDQVSIYKKISDGLLSCSQELTAIGNENFYPTPSDTNNIEFSKLLNDINANMCDISNYTNHKSILNPYDNSIEDLIPTIERDKHTYITGQTGSGKSVLMTTLLYRDFLRNDCSTILLDPHGDLAENIVKLVHDKTRLVYINPFMSDDKTPTINLFHLINKNESNIARVTQVILNVLKSVNSDETFSGAMEDVLENCIRVLLRKEGGSFKELYRFMNDKRNKDLIKYGKESPNSMEAEFFNDDFENSKPTKDAIRRRLKKLLNDHIFSNLMSGDNTINLEQLMNTKGKIIIFNIPKGKMPNTYKYYIRFIVEYIQIIALKRADFIEDDRVHTHLYIDEAHNFITSTATISEILTESRKYKLFVTFAHQTITQIKDANLRDIMTTMTNVKIIGKNSNKTLDALNKTLNTKLEDVEKLGTGEFYLSAGNNDIIEVHNTDILVDGKENVTNAQWEEHKQYQLDNYYRSVQSLDTSKPTTEDLNQKLEDFTHAIKSINTPYFDKVSDNKWLYDELIYNFNDGVEDASGYISKQDLYLYFNLVYDHNYFHDNKEFLKMIKSKDEFFKQDVNQNKTYNSKKRYAIS